ncbi:uncharacterized protein [Argopecten irradians]|uniref:uncharacterized protein n=1 Tax=Argopecten irradians TaxID=31199 RepID=UPI00371B33D4
MADNNVDCAREIYNFRYVENVHVGDNTNYSSKSAIRRYKQRAINDFVEYRTLADKVQEQVYQGKHIMPHIECLKECEEWLSCDLDRKVYGLLFAKYEGLADTLRTSSDVTEGLADHDVYKCMEKLVPRTSFQDIARMIYKFRYAAALAVSGKVDIAMTEARAGYETLRNYLEDKKMAKANSSCFYGYINVHLGEFSVIAARTNVYNREKKTYILTQIDEGLMQVHKIADDDRNIEIKNRWARMFLVKKAFCCLNIGLNGEDVFDPEELYIEKVDMDKARACLEKAKTQYWTNTDDRREMLYNRAQAKLIWLEGHHEEGIKTLKAAIEIAVKFKREKNNFQRILKKWRQAYWVRRAKFILASNAAKTFVMLISVFLLLIAIYKEMRRVIL